MLGRTVTFPVTATVAPLVPTLFRFVCIGSHIVG